MVIGATKEQHYAWRGGKTTNGHYIRTMEKGHPRGDRNGYVLEHVLIAEKALGRPLPDSAEVHHVNEIKTDNRSENLVICQDRAYHSLLHARTRALKACGDANARHCYLCKQWEIDPAVAMETRASRMNFRHKQCRIEYERKMRPIRKMNKALLTVKPLGN